MAATTIYEGDGLMYPKLDVQNSHIQLIITEAHISYMYVSQFLCLF